MNEKKKSFKTLSEDIKARRTSPIPKEKVDAFNKIMEEEDRLRQEKQKNNPEKAGKKKIANPSEIGV
ncbi:MAG: hypothetical protein AABY64_13790 [Bdellovibrionota bacterium]